MIETQPPTAQPVSAAEPDATPLVSLSDAAAGKLRELTADETDPAVGLRVYVYSGGCSRYRHRMMLEDQPTEQDVKVDSQGINVHMDRSGLHMEQAELRLDGSGI